MNERRDDTTKTGGESRPEGGAPGRYYYDDATGYETYRPGAEDDEEEDAGGDAKDGGGGDAEGRVGDAREAD